MAGEARPPAGCVERAGWRWAEPWWDVWCQNVRGKWVGNTVLAVLLSELPVTEATILHAFRHGLVTLQPTLRKPAIVIPPGHVLRLNEVLHYKFHRHEPSVPATSPAVLFHDADVVVVSKPAGYPVHPIGRFHRCTVTGMLRLLHPDFADIRPTHRLDRLVSGCLIFARTKASAQRVTEAFRNRDVKKMYVARVTGQLPQPHVVVRAPIGRISALTEPPAFGVVDECDGGKSAVTTLEDAGVVFGDGTRLVRCFPETGRTHQIRVHLASVGCPIANDSKYTTRAVDTTTLPPLPRRPLSVKDPRCLECFLSDDELWGEHVTEYERRAAEIWLHAVRYTIPASLLVSAHATTGANGGPADTTGSMRTKRRKTDATTVTQPKSGSNASRQPPDGTPVETIEWSVPLPDWAKCA
eukprot:m.158941 g.158941  ORF g.158941 m.158941 type:complete len:411 (-) comp23712_c0_seq1:420-1652(-)